MTISSNDTLSPTFVVAMLLVTVGVFACDQEGSPDPEDAELMDHEDDEAFDDLIDEPEAPVWDDTRDPVGGLTAEAKDPVPLTGTSKVCSVYVPNDWRDTILMNDNNNWTQCNNFKMSVGAPNLQLGCLDDSGIHFGWPGTPGGPPGLPYPNCGW